MIKIKNEIKKKHTIFFKSPLGSLKIFNINEKIRIPKKIYIILKKDFLLLKGPELR